MKQIMKTLLTLVIVAVGMVTGSSVAMAENYVAVNAANFPDQAVRNALERVAKEGLSNDGEYIEETEYDANSYGRFCKDSSGVISVDTDSVKELLVQDVDGTVYNADCLKKFRNLNWVSIYKYGASSFSLDQKDLEIYLGEISTSAMTVSAGNAIRVYVAGTKNLKSITVKAPNATNVSIDGKKITKISLGNMKKLNSLYLNYILVKSLDVSKYTKLKGLYIYNSSISKITGLKKLSQLNYFTACGTDLKALDLSSNKKLESLSCISNKKLTSLKAPASVVYLWATDNNIKSLNLKNLKKLRYLEVNGNKNLKSIDISKNTNLMDLNVGCTKISKLNLKNNKKLTALSCYQTKISSLNLKKNKKLTYLSFYGSKLKKLDLSKHKTMSLYFETKKGKTINLKNYIGSGYKVTSTYGSLSYSKSSGKIKVKKKGYSSINLKKGSRTYYISVYAK